jgi:hypothetical protein
MRKHIWRDVLTAAQILSFRRRRSRIFSEHRMFLIYPQKKKIYKYEEQLNPGLRNCRYCGRLSLSNTPCSFELFEPAVGVVHMR